MSNKTSKKIEKIAIKAVEDFFLYSNTVDTYLASNDKEPVWDGHFYIYNNKDLKKEHLIGRVPAQIKGKSVKAFKTNNFKYTIEMSDLKAYLHEGTYYIVVQEVNLKTKIFYRELTPVLVRNIINAHKGQKSANVLLYQFPYTCEEAETNLRQFLLDCRSQVSFVDGDPFTFEDLKKNGITTFSISRAVNKDNKPSLITVTQKPVYLYANLTDKIKIPIGDGPVKMSFSNTVKLPVKVNGTTYYDHYQSRLENGYALFTIGNSLEVKMTHINKDEVTLNFNFSSKNIKSLKQAINDANFILDLAKTNKIQIGNKELLIPKIEDNNFLDFWKNSLKSWVALQETLEILHVKENLDLSLLKKKDESTIDILIAMIKEKKEVSLTAKKSSIVNLTIGNLYLWLVIVKLKNGKFRMFNFFDRSSGVQGFYKYPDGKFQDSIYSTLDDKELLKCSNVYYDDVVASYKELIGKNPHVYERANAFGLYLIAASDSLQNYQIRKNDFMNCAEQLFSWLSENDNPNTWLYSLNIIQIHKRKGMLNERDRDVLNVIHSDAKASSILKFGAALLSDNFNEAKSYWEEIEIEDKKIITQQPIWKFAKGKIDYNN